MHPSSVQPWPAMALADDDLSSPRGSPREISARPAWGATDWHEARGLLSSWATAADVAGGDAAPVSLSAPCPRVGEPPDGLGFVGLLHAFFDTGGTLDSAALDRLLKACWRGQAEGLSGLLASRQVFGFEWRDALWIPMFQFNSDDLSVRPGSQRVRDELPVLWSGWNQACWFASPNVWLGGRTPVEMIDAAPQDIEGAARSWRPEALARP